MQLKITNGAVEYGATVILEEVNLEIKDKDRIAIVGRNGAGKTTLLKALIDNELFSEGIGEEPFSIVRQGTIKFGYLEQITFSSEECLLIDEIKKSFSELIAMEEKMQTLVSAMSSDNSPALINEYTRLENQYRLLGGYRYQKEYEVMLHKFGFSEEDKIRPLKSFSGGERTKIAFIKLLLSEPDILLLDEPTNHLDILTIEWLEDYLKNYAKTLIVVSHDRMFLDRIVNVIYAIEYGKTTRYVGNYQAYEQEHRLRYERLLKNYEEQQKEIERLHNIYLRFRAKPTKARMALSKLKAIEKMDIIKRPDPIDVLTFKTNLADIHESVKVVLRAKDLVIGYDHPLAKVSFEIVRGEHIGVIGANGVGKSTLLKTLHGLIPPIDGSLQYGLHVEPGYFDQSLADINNEATVLSDFRASHPELLEEEARRALGSFLFKGEEVFKSISVLSGGEKVRLQLCKLLYNKPNFLILDEPTNHMDIDSKEYLEQILSTYPGTIIFVSHDRYFINKIATQLLVFTGDDVAFYPYGYAEYSENNHQEFVASPKKSSSKPKEKEVIIEVDPKKELAKVEKAIITLEVRQKKVTNELYDEKVYLNPAESQKKNQELEQINQELAELNTKWEELVDLIQ